MESYRAHVQGLSLSRLKEACNWLEVAKEEDMPPPLSGAKEMLAQMRSIANAELLRRVQDYCTDWTMKHYPDVILSHMDLEDIDEH